jgi:folate-binding protein YgfZ
MQNLFCNDIKQVSDDHSQLSALCSAKGRVLALFRIFKHAGIYYLQLPSEILEATINRLRMYVLSAKVTLEDASDSFVRIGISLPDRKHSLSTIINIPEQTDATSTTDGMTVIKISASPDRYEIICNLDEAIKIWGQLDVHAAPTGTNTWRLLNIRAGIPNIYTSTVDAFIPQMINMQALNAISFKKGCYPGQEITARTQYLGKLKRGMYLGHISNATQPLPGNPLYAANDKENQSIGKVVDAQPSPDGGYDLLAVLLMTHAKSNHALLQKNTSDYIEFKSLPYNID